MHQRPKGQRLDLRFEDAVVIEGRVVDTAGEPMPGALVALINDRRAVVSGTADEDGSFRLQISPKLPFPLRLEAALKGRHVTYGKVSPETPLPIEIVLP